MKLSTYLTTNCSASCSSLIVLLKGLMLKDSAPKAHRILAGVCQHAPRLDGILLIECVAYRAYNSPWCRNLGAPAVKHSVNEQIFRITMVSRITIKRSFKRVSPTRAKYLVKLERHVSARMPPIVYVWTWAYASTRRELLRHSCRRRESCVIAGGMPESMWYLAAWLF